MEPSLTPIPPEPKKPFAPWVWLPFLSGIGALAALVAASLLFPGWLVIQEACLVGFALVVELLQMRHDANRKRLGSPR